MNFIKTLLTLLLILTAPAAWGAGPYLVCDPQEGVTDYKLVCLNLPEQQYPAQPDGSAKIDISGIESASTQCELFAGAAYTIDGQPQEAIEWSASVPFVLGRPGALQSPTNIGLRNE